MTAETRAALGRFRILRKIGAGAFGSVYEVLDPELDAKVALKRLERLDPTSLYRFKNEFRNLRRVVHPNVVQLHELFVDESDTFFTMELCHGTDFVSHLRGDATQGTARTADVSTIADARIEPREMEAVTSSPLSLDRSRVQSATVKLVRAISHIHRAGLLHRDLKPSNVLVEADGRVVVVDFGIASDAAADEAKEISGTPAYMAPEQAVGSALPASDWYALGVMLFEAHAGRRPFFGNDRRSLREKLLRPPPRLSEFQPGIAPELDQLVYELLAIDPALRPNADSILHRLGVGEADAAHVELGDEPMRQSLIGREAPLLELERAEDEGAVVLLGGESGIGKTALLAHFAERARNRGARVLESRCYQNEAIRYNAMDGAIDALVRELVQSHEGELERLAVPGAAALTRVFPALTRLEPLVRMQLSHADVLDRQELRRRAFGALRSLFQALATERSLTIIVDDAQWSDADSAALIAAVWTPPPLGVRLVLAYRSEDKKSQTLAALFAALEPSAPRSIELRPLDEHDAKTLLDRVLGVDPDPEKVTALLASSRGNPFFLEQLGRHASVSVHALDLEAVLETRVAELGTDARLLLELIAIAGQPLERRILVSAASTDAVDALACLGELRDRQLIRVAAGAASNAFDTYHDRIRGALLGQLTADARERHHAALADALTSNGSDDYEALFTHEKQAGRRALAARHAELAAATAAAALAFDRAVELYREALALAELTSDRKREIELRLVDALQSAGRGVQAADILLRLSDGSEGIERLDFARRASEQLLVSGSVPRGLMACVIVLSAVGLSIARFRWWAVVQTIVLRLFIRWRGLGHEERAESEIDPLDLIRIDICETLAGGLGFNDHLRGAPFSARYTLLALRAGEPRRLARALALEGAYAGATGDVARADDLFANSLRIAERSQRPDTLAPVIGIMALSRVLRGDFREAIGGFGESFRLYREEGGMSQTTSHFEYSMLRQYYLSALYYLGEIGTLARELPEALASADDRGNIGFSTSLRVSDTSAFWLLQDRTAELREEVARALRAWPDRPFVLPHLFALLSLAQADLYEGKPEDAVQRFETEWQHVSRSLLLRAHRTRVLALAGRGRAHVAAAVAGLSAKANLKRASALSRALARLPAPWVQGQVALLDACILRARGDEKSCRAQLEEAVISLSRADLRLYAAVAERALAPESRRAGHYFESEGVLRPDRVMRVLAPGFE